MCSPPQESAIISRVDRVAADVHRGLDLIVAGAWIVRGRPEGAAVWRLDAREEHTTEVAPRAARPRAESNWWGAALDRNELVVGARPLSGEPTALRATGTVFLWRRWQPVGEGTLELFEVDLTGVICVD